MINKQTLKFLKELKVNNSKEWLDENREKYDFAKNDILTLTEQLITAVSDFDKTILNAYLDPKKCITRLNRDLRFAKDKTPYKTDYYIVLNRDGKNSPSAFYFLHIEPDNCFVRGGVYNPQPEQLKKIRQEIDYAFDEWTAIIKDKLFKKTFPSGINNSGVLSRTPKEFDEENKASEFLKMKGFYTMEKLTDKEILSEDTFKKISSYFKTTKPLVDFLNKAIEND
ncbi:MAG: DUF2461 domain-containing protein [Chitinophagaceae bacterium]|nr:DUF2461 domain-containing protein [Chitinophagaceae bacterium]